MEKGTLSNHLVAVEYSKNSLRITGFTPHGGSNLLVDLSAMKPVKTSYGEFHFQGGHRLWHAPEAMPRTYVPDENGLDIQPVPNGVSLTTLHEPVTSIRKRMVLALDPLTARLTIEHSLINDGLWPVTLAPWAITQFRTGGKVLLPLHTGNSDAAGLLPNRQITLWPYTDTQDERLKVGNAAIAYHALPIDKSFKIGSFTQHGWMAYLLDGVLFKKSFSSEDDGLYPDQNCNAEIYGCADFVELESLGKMQTLAPGETCSHQEVWEVEPDLHSLPTEIRKLL